MAVLTDDMKQLVAEQKLGYVASVAADGTPNLSPKGTFLVRDEDHIMFAEMRSPNTLANIETTPNVEVNFVDIFSRKDFRFKGLARFIAKGTEEYEALLPPFLAEWSALSELFNGIVVIKVETALPLVSPAYDISAEEAQLRRQWLNYFTKLQGRTTKGH
jgi:predicted pyridoxine 5'-phosphate oxidase superfamily flavin-nucleotide-binding protein